MNAIDIEKLNQLISRTDISGNDKIKWLTDFIDGRELQQDETGEYIIGVDPYPYSEKNNVLKDEIFTDDECDENPLICQSRYPLQIILKEIQRGRPAESQYLIQTWIDNLDK